jgi:hypothetical protein
MLQDGFRKIFEPSCFMWIQRHHNFCSLCRRRSHTHLLHKPVQKFVSDIRILAQISSSFSRVYRCLMIVPLLFEMTPEKAGNTLRYLLIVF